jgi:hypothetical protein
MTTRRRAVVGITAFTFIVCGALALWYWVEPTPLRNPIVSVPFDVGHKGASAEAQVRISQDRSWIVVVSFKTSDPVIRSRLLDMFRGDWARGIASNVPIHLTIAKIGSDNAHSATVYDANIDAMAPYAGGVGSYEAQIVAINLHPGLYRVSVTALAETSALAGLEADLEIEYRAYVQFIPYAVTPIGDK